MMPDPVLLSRLQFFWVISFHILLPAFTVGLACYIAVLETLYLKTGDHTYFRVSVFWTRIFAVSFGLGVVSGIVMPFQFGTNWSRFSDAAANVIGPLMAYEGLTAFFLEASFLGVLLFGRKLVPPWAHCFAAAMVAVGTLFSSFWIFALNSWMQTPAGYEIIEGRFHAADWVAVIFNPSFPFRIATAFLVTTGFVVVGVAAYYLRRARAIAEARKMLSMTLWLLTFLVPLQIGIGDLHGLNTFHHQPAKLAAMEGHWETQSGAPFIIIGWPDQEADVTRWAIEVPYLGSLILTHNGTRIEGVAARRQAAAGDRLLVISRDGRNRNADDAGRCPGELVALEQPTVRHRLVPARVRGLPAPRLCRRDCRLDHDRGWAATLGDLRPDAHQGRRDPFVGRLRRFGLAHHLHARLPRRVPCDSLLHDQSRARWS
jgi:cytochrome bd-type quinol oxidase subunit 1